MKPDGHEQMKLSSVFWQLYLHGAGINSHSLTSVIFLATLIIIALFIIITIFERSAGKLTDTLNTRLVGLVAFVADASVGTESIDAQTIPAEIGDGLAFVDISRRR
jgi:formate hydrogenlyase subunit 4